MSAEFPFVDPATMKTEVGQKLARDLNRDVAEGREQVHRLSRVLYEWILFNREAQLGLVEAAIYWVTAAIATNDRRNECQSNFYCFVDSMYASTQEAEDSLDECKREQITVAAAAVQRHISSALPEILAASVKQIKSAFSNGLPLNIVTELHAMSRRYIEHVPEPVLRDLVMKCVVLCQAIEAELLGIGASEETEKSLVDLAKASVAIVDDIHKAIERGRLVVENGVVVDPFEDVELDDDEDEGDDEEDD